LAVRWHPQATSIVFVDKVNGRHGLFEFDLATQGKRRIMPHSADAIVFDWTSDGQLVCGLGHHAARHIDGLWIGLPGEASWWHVPESQSPAPARLGSLLERLRASRPAWSNNGRTFAFVSAPPTAKSNPSSHVRIWRGDLATRDVELLAASDLPVAD